MSARGTAIYVYYKAWDTSANAGKTGDVANHTLKWVKDGTASSPSNSAAEVDSTNAPGLYKLLLTSTECTCDSGIIGGKSSTANVVIIERAYTFETLIKVDSSGRCYIVSNTAKNTGLNGFEFFMTDSTTHAAKTGLTVTAQRSLDGAAFGSCANSAAEVGNGLYQINLAAADLNANTVTLRFTATNADDRIIEIVTQPQ